MNFDGKIGSFSTRVEPVLAPGHDAVILTGPIKPNQGAWPPGTILTRDNGELTPWEGTGEPVGVLFESCDSDEQFSANYVGHGTVGGKILKKKDGSAPTQDEVFILHKIGIWGI